MYIYIYLFILISEVQLAQLLSNKCYDFTPLTPKKDDSSGQPNAKGHGTEISRASEGQHLQTVEHTFE